MDSINNIKSDDNNKYNNVSLKNCQINLGKGSKIKLIIFVEFSAKGYPPTVGQNHGAQDLN